MKYVKLHQLHMGSIGYGVHKDLGVKTRWKTGACTFKNAEKLIYYFFNILNQNYTK